jgi:hypothetical protein
MKGFVTAGVVDEKGSPDEVDATRYDHAIGSALVVTSAYIHPYHFWATALLLEPPLSTPLPHESVEIRI